MPARKRPVEKAKETSQAGPTIAAREKQKKVDAALLVLRQEYDRDSQNSDNSDSEQPYKDAEFEAFIETLEDGVVEHWEQLARVLGVSQNTITRWKEHPKAKAATRYGIRKAMVMMQVTGMTDWRMWDQKMKLLGIDIKQKVELSDPNGNPINDGIGSAITDLAAAITGLTNQGPTPPDGDQPS